MSKTKTITATVNVNGVPVTYKGRTSREYTDLIITAKLITTVFKDSVIADLEQEIANAPSADDVQKARDAFRLSSKGQSNPIGWTPEARRLWLESNRMNQRARNARWAAEGLPKAKAMKTGWVFDEVIRAGRSDLAAKAMVKALDKANARFKRDGLERKVVRTPAVYL